MKQRIYIDTSVVGGFFDEEFKDATQRLFTRLENKEVRFVVSDLLELELIQAPKYVRELLLTYPTDCFERVELTQENNGLGRQVHHRKGCWTDQSRGLSTYCPWDN